jgi:hypothetical protein
MAHHPGLSLVSSRRARAMNAPVWLQEQADGVRPRVLGSDAS